MINIIISAYIASSIPQLIFLNTLELGVDKVGIAMAIYTSPALLFASLLGKISDKISTKLILITSNIINIIILLLYLLSQKELVFYIMLLVLSSINLLIQINSWVFIAKEFDDESSVVKYNSTMSLYMTLAMIISPLINSFIVKYNNKYMIFTLLITLSIFSFIISFLLPIRNESKEVFNDESKNNIGALKILFSSKALIIVILSTILINLAFSIINIIIVPYLISIGTQEYIAITYGSFFSIGSIAASLYLREYKINDFSRFCIYSIVMPIVIFFFSILFKNYMIVFVGLILIALSRTFGATIRTTIQQQNIPEASMGTVIGVCTTITWGINPIGSIIAGTSSNYISAIKLILIACFLLFLGSILMIFLRNYWSNSKR
ncbi:MFS transporter [Clostridium tagluense]|uniref:MFS transporter n=1 Tax=Clostridium tagluense TaxID=360422 RepID=UPI001C6DDA28|nr:MFS transporter [Clostridium tagluense]MBW9159469.1 MFS transporter [Clostridium tagluense]WLC68477.1 MFS transporter [Clostridium tagluense]